MEPPYRRNMPCTCSIRNISNPHPTWRADAPPSSWHGVEVDFNTESVRSLTWINLGLQGMLPWCDCPPALEKLNFCRNELSGSVDFAELPAKLRLFAISINMFSGELCFEGIPPSIKVLQLSSNRFYGKVDLSPLLGRPIRLDLSQNFLTDIFPKVSFSGITIGVQCNEQIHNFCFSVSTSFV